METSTRPKLLTERETALYLTVSRAYLSATRVRHSGGPPFIKFGRTVRYLVSDLDAWIVENRVTHNQDGGDRESTEEETFLGGDHEE